MSEAYTMKQHMTAHHEAAASHHQEMAKCEMAKAEHHTALAALHAAADQEDMSASHKALAKVCKLAAAEHTSEAKRHGEMMKAVETVKKSMTNAMIENRGYLVPDGISGIIPEHRVTAVPRTGQRDLGKSAPVDPEFEHFVQMED